MVATAAMLNKDEVVAYVAHNAGRYGLDPAAVLAVANQEGLNKTPGYAWTLPNEGGSFNFGPPSWNSGWPGHPAAGTAIVQQQGSAAAYWAWTPAGIDYWLQTVANSGASGLTGMDAIAKIVQNFENPRADLVGKEINNAWNNYKSFQQQIQIPIPGGITIPPIPLPGQPSPPVDGQPGEGQLPIPHLPGQYPATPSASVGAKFSLHLFDTPGGPINLTLPWDFSGILLFLAAIFCILIGALMWDKSREVIVKGAETGAMVA